jgi:peptide chain release factor
MEYPDIRIIGTVPGIHKGCFKSIRLGTVPQDLGSSDNSVNSGKSGKSRKSGSDLDLTHLEGSVQWICQSPFRSHHKRKNWYVDISLVGKAERLEFDDNLIRFETFRSSGKGGQHVNKVETGVRAVYTPLGLSVESTEARSQHMNKKLALNRLCLLIAEMNQNNEADAARLSRLEHTRLVRGNPVRVYEGMGFHRIQ